MRFFTKCKKIQHDSLKKIKDSIPVFYASGGQPDNELAFMIPT